MIIAPRFNKNRYSANSAGAIHCEAGLAICCREPAADGANEFLETIAHFDTVEDPKDFGDASVMTSEF
jgi:hypothetical protein